MFSIVSNINISFNKEKIEFTFNLDQEMLKSKGWKKGGWAKRKVIFDHGFPKEIKEYENYIKYANLVAQLYLMQ